MRHAVEIGTFVKTNSPQVVELLGATGLDFVCIDAEHAPFSRNALDAMLMASRATRLRAFVRIPDRHAATVLNALDLGADGLLVPHVDSADEARGLVAASRYRDGMRGYSGSTRAAGYGSLSMVDVLRKGDATPVICQIESVADEAHNAVDDGIARAYVGLISSVPHGTPPVRHNGIRSAHSADAPRARFRAHPSRHRSW